MIKKRCITNQKRKNQIISFQSDLNPITLGYVKRLAKRNEKSEFINKAIEMRFLLENNKKQFIKQILENDYELCRYLLRKIGRYR